MNWTQLLTNLIGTLLAGAAAGYATTGSWQGALLGGITAAAGNQAGLHQNPPTR